MSQKRFEEEMKNFKKPPQKGKVHTFAILKLIFAVLISIFHSDRQGSVVMESVVKGVVNSLVDVESYKKKLAMQVCVNSNFFIYNF